MNYAKDAQRLLQENAALTAERDALKKENERLRIELLCVVERMAIIEAHENEELQALKDENARLREWRDGI